MPTSLASRSGEAPFPPAAAARRCRPPATTDSNKIQAFRQSCCRRACSCTITIITQRVYPSPGGPTSPAVNSEARETDLRRDVCCVGFFGLQGLLPHGSSCSNMPFTNNTARHMCFSARAVAVAVHVRVCCLAQDPTGRFSDLRLCRVTHSAPARLIADNAGVEGEVIVQSVLGKSFETGYNAMDDRVEDLVAAGIIDPAKAQSPARVSICSLGAADCMALGRVQDTVVHLVHSGDG